MSTPRVFISSLLLTVATLSLADEAAAQHSCCTITGDFLQCEPHDPVVCADIGGFLLQDVCPPPQFGSCCLFEQCFNTDAPQCCQAMGGVFTPEADCFLPGACFMPDGSCVEESAPCCEAMGGTFLPFEGCTGEPGACCLPDQGSCIDTLDNGCGPVFGGEFVEGTTCGDGACELAPCCLLEPTGFTCIDELEVQLCHDLGGAVPSVPCPTTAPPGTCCLPDGSCVEAFGSECCEAHGGTFSNELSCDPLGACCYDDGSCTETSEQCCENQGGTFTAGGQCSSAVGACCMPDASCEDGWNETCCENAGGSLMGDGSACELTTGACCMPDGTCKDDVTFPCCLAAGGNYLGDGEVCSQVTGACCFDDGSCVSNATDTCCEDAGGYFHDGENCPSTVTETCCMADGTCGGANVLCCEDLGGTVVQGFCSQDFGACCDGDGNCFETRKACCELAGYQFAGDGSSCDDSPPPCCQDDSDCEPAPECKEAVCSSGLCTYPNADAGTACGDAADTDCTDPDTCDGAGNCDDNHAPDGMACSDDDNVCTDDVCDNGTCTHPPDPDYSELLDSGEVSVDLGNLEAIESLIKKAPIVGDASISVGAGGSYTKEEVCCPLTGPTTNEYTVSGEVTVDISIKFNLPNAAGKFEVSLPFGIGSGGFSYSIGPYIKTESNGLSVGLTGTYREAPCEAGCVAVTFNIPLSVELGVDIDIRVWGHLIFVGEISGHVSANVNVSGGVSVSSGFELYGSGCAPPTVVTIDPIKGSASLSLSWGDWELGSWDTGTFEVTAYEGGSFTF